MFSRTITLLTLLVCTVPPAVAATAPVTVEFSVRDSWSTGYVADVVLTNNGSEDINEWTISFDLPVSFTNFWNVVEGASTATRKVFTHNANTALLRAGSTRNFGFVALGDPTVLPSNILFNGLPPGDSPPTLVITDLQVDEGDAARTVSFPVFLSAPLDSTVTVEYSTGDDTALAGVHYTSTSGTLTFAPGITELAIPIQIFGDSAEAPDKRFIIHLSQPNGVALASATARLTLRDDDSPASAMLLHAPIDDFPTGPKTDHEWRSLWPGTKWANGPDEGRLAVDEEISIAAGGKAIRVLYPQGGQQSGNSGAQWFIDIGGEYEDLYMSYWVRFDEDFDFVLGGKLPGFGGAVSFDDRTHEWSGRLMWREEGKAEFYIHVPAENDFDPGDRFWWNTEGFQATFVPGRWHHIEIHLRMNTPGRHDGLAEGWFDGVKAAHYPTFYFRDTPTQTARIAWVFFSTFFGGSSSDIWQARKDEHAWFDDIQVSTTRIGYPGLPRDVDADRLPNDWETAYFGSSTAASAKLDSDGDGEDNYREYLAGTHPNNAGDRLKTTMSTLEGNTLDLRVNAKAGRIYRLESTTDLRTWTPVTQTGVLPADQPLSFPRPITATPTFYRVVVLLP